MLKDVGYVIEAHAVLTARAGEGETIAKHIEMFKCHAAKGQCLQQPLQWRQSGILFGRLIYLVLMFIIQAVPRETYLFFMFYWIDCSCVDDICGFLMVLKAVIWSFNQSSVKVHF